MKFLTMLVVTFSVIYLVLMVHAFRFPTQQKVDELGTLSLHVKETKPSVFFPSNDYQRFVYAQ